MRSLFKFCLVALLTVALATPGAFAQGKGKGQGKGTGSATAAGTGTGAGGGQSGDHGPGTTPGGYEGKKTGWGECDVPPGHAKPAHCTDKAKEHAKGKAKDKDAKEHKEKAKENKEKAKDKTDKAKAKGKA